jgi:hypothetical protein
VRLGSSLNELNHRLDEPAANSSDQLLAEPSNQIPLRHESVADWSAKVSQSTTEKKQAVLDTKYFRQGGGLVLRETWHKILNNSILHRI